MLWNLAQLANALLPLIAAERAAAIAAATSALAGFSGLYQAAWLAHFRAKLGSWRRVRGTWADRGAVGRMAAQEADFTRTFRGLADGSARAEFKAPAGV
jgi:uncharacterized protein YdiU (UPF0061 family)